MYINSVMLFGNLTCDPELRALPNGTSVASFSLATNETCKKGDGSRAEHVEFHNVVVFGSQANTICNHLKKGSSALVEGRIRTRSWDKDGERRYRMEIVADRVQFGPRRGQGQEEGSSDASEEAEEREAPQPQPKLFDYPTSDIDPADIPF